MSTGGGLWPWCLVMGKQVSVSSAEVVLSAEIEHYVATRDRQTRRSGFQSILLLQMKHDRVSFCHTDLVPCESLVDCC